MSLRMACLGAAISTHQDNNIASHLARCGLTESPAAEPALPARAMSAHHAGAALAAQNGAASLAHAAVKLARSPAPMLPPLLPLPADDDQPGSPVSQ